MIQALLVASEYQFTPVFELGDGATGNLGQSYSFAASQPGATISIYIDGDLVTSQADSASVGSAFGTAGSHTVTATSNRGGYYSVTFTIS
jgi:ribonuclease HIII